MYGLAVYTGEKTMGKRGKIKLTHNAFNFCDGVKELLKVIETKRRFWQLTGQDLGDLCGMTQPSVQQALTGKVNCSFKRAVHMANALGIEVMIRTRNGAMPKEVKLIKRFNETKLKQNRHRQQISRAARNGTRILDEIDELRANPPAEQRDY